MFIQVISGRVSDPEALRRSVARWRSDLKPGAAGYLGSTGGVTADGRGITLVRFESEEAALANSDRPEQGAWWAEASKAYESDVTFTNSTEIDTSFGGGSNAAGFVQVIKGRAKDKDELRRRGKEMDDALRVERPDILGMTLVWDGDDFVQAVYFTDEATARAGEAKMSDDPKFQEWGQLMEPDLEFFDLTEPDLD